MSITKLGIYDRQGLRRHWDFDWGIYAAFAPASETETYVKIGVSSQVYHRMVSLRTGCPFRIEMCLWSTVGSKKMAYTAEQEIHETFAGRRMSGEWFKFDTSSQSDKEEFSAVTKFIYLRHTGRALAWSRITAEQITAYAGAYEKPQLEDA